METALINHLLAQTALTDIVADRITWGRRAQGAALPAIVLHRIDAAPDYHMTGPSGLVERRVQADCWAADQEQTASGDTVAKDLAAVLTLALSGARFTRDSIRFDGVFVVDENDDSFDESGTALYRTRLDLMVHHAAA